MKIRYKRYFMLEKLRKIQFIYPFFFFILPYSIATQRPVFYLCKIILLCGTAQANRQAYPTSFRVFFSQPRNPWGRYILGCSRDKHGNGCVTTKRTSVWHRTADFVLSAKSFVFSFCPHLSPFVLNSSSFVSMLRTPLEEDPLLQVFH